MADNRPPLYTEGSVDRIQPASVDRPFRDLALDSLFAGVAL